MNDGMDTPSGAGTPGGLIGRSMPRKEDDRLLRGYGRYLDDVREPPGTLHVCFVRSPHAHARIRRIDTARARAVPGVVAVATGADLAAAIRPMRADYDKPGYTPTDWAALPTERVRYVGETVAAVVADSPYVAEDAAELVEVDYEALPVAVDCDTAMAPGAPRIHDELTDNVFFRSSFRTDGFDDAFAAADLVLNEDFVSTRIATLSLEPRGCMADFDPGSGVLTFWSSTQIPHILRTSLAELLGLPETSVRAIAPDVGGGFGMKANVYPEEVVVAALARRLRRPVKWQQDRLEDLLRSAQAREHLFRTEIAVDRDGTVRALRVKILVNTGAYAAYPFGSGIEAGGGALMMPGAYRLKNYAFEAIAVATNVCPAGTYRGVAQPSAQFAIEGLMDRIARRLGMDPADVRMRNIVRKSDFPYTNVMGVPYDSGSFAECLRHALDLVGYDDYRRTQTPDRLVDGKYRGIGIACITEHTGLGSARYRARGLLRVPGYESASVRVGPDGRAVAHVSYAAQGQGHETTWAQIVAERLGIPYDDVVVLQGDSEQTPYGTGAIASRGAVAAGGAVMRAADKVREKVLRIAADVLEASPADLDIGDGHVAVRGAPRLRVALTEIAAIAHAAHDRPIPDGEEYGLVALDHYDPPITTITNAAHVVCLAIDPGTGSIDIERYVVVHDCGRVINPQIVEGQVHGGVAQGLGQALMERIRYDREGQLLTANLLDYLIPQATDIPDIELDHFETPSLQTVGGFKGVGEGGVIGAIPALANAVADALSGAGVNVNRLPLTPDWVWAALAASRPAS